MTAWGEQAGAKDKVKVTRDIPSATCCLVKHTLLKPLSPQLDMHLALLGLLFVAVCQDLQAALVCIKQGSKACMAEDCLQGCEVCTKEFACGFSGAHAG